MALVIRDKELDKNLSEIALNLRKMGITNATKTDAIRYILESKKQGKKTHPMWSKIL